MGNIITEFLITFDGKGEFCKNVAGFNSLLESIDELKCQGDSIRYKELQLLYANTLLEEDGSRNRIFHAVFTLLNAEEDHVLLFEKLMRDIRNLFYKLSLNREVITLYDGISGYYGEKAYPLLHKLENKMRKLLTQFMFVKIGDDWDKENIPQTIENVLERKRDSNTFDYLYQIDFIHLSDFLFNKHSPKSQQDLIAFLQKNAEALEELDLEELRKYIPKSNWEKYFQNIVNCEGEQLQKCWERLYALRCAVAHNNKFNSTDYKELCLLYEKIEPVITEATKKLDHVVISDADRQELSEELLAVSNEYYGEFLAVYSKFETAVSLLANQNDIYGCKTVVEFMKKLTDKDIISIQEAEELSRVCDFRNYLVHSPDKRRPPDEQVLSELAVMKAFLKKVATDEADTIIVAAREDGFQDVFLGENRWFPIRISELMRKKIKYIAAYRSAPVSGVTHVAEVEKIEPFCGTDEEIEYYKTKYGGSYGGKYVVYFKGPAREIRTIPIENPQSAIQSTRYTNYNKLMIADTVEQLFEK